MRPVLWTVTGHFVYLNDPAGMRCDEVPHTFISYENDANLRRSGESTDAFLYANQPLAAATRYVGRVTGT